MSDDTDLELEEIRRRKAEGLKKELEMEKDKKGWPDSPIEINDLNFKDIISRYPLIFIDFWAPWCGPCKMVGPIIDQLAKDYQGKVVFGKLNVDENPVTAKSFKVMSIPTMMLVKEREMVERITGAMPKITIKNTIDKHL